MQPGPLWKRALFLVNFLLAFEGGIETHLLPSIHWHLKRDGSAVKNLVIDAKILSSVSVTMFPWKTS